MLIANGVSLTVCRYFDELRASDAGTFCAISSLNEIGVKTDKIEKKEDGCRVWPHGTVCSVSHKNKIAVSIASYKSTFCGIGIDLETISNHRSIMEAASVFLSQEEHKIICDFDSLNYSTAMYVVFSAKESAYKAISNFIKSPLIFSKLIVCGISSTTQLYGMCKINSLYKEANTEIYVRYIIENDIVCTIATIKNFKECSIP